ncbi:hypothetical protein [Paenibacillus sp. N3.4]|uniref:hypothetical protein n=1 Tax=Paenibacillus sp. N3.4 TaxID=2603222 RepID=UPI00164FBF78|nr:hypothetical protein [Paenibacillus sp. N3.4]
MSTNENNDVVSHAINAAQANAEDSKSKEQVEQLSSELQNTTATSSVEESSTEE